MSIGQTKLVKRMASMCKSRNRYPLVFRVWLGEGTVESRLLLVAHEFILPGCPTQAPSSSEETHICSNNNQNHLYVSQSCSLCGSRLSQFYYPSCTNNFEPTRQMMDAAKNSLLQLSPANEQHRCDRLMYVPRFVIYSPTNSHPRDFGCCSRINVRGRGQRKGIRINKID